MLLRALMITATALLSGCATLVPTQVTLSPYAIQKTEVTVAQYRACVRAGRCSSPSGDSGKCNWSLPGRDDHPINCVSWNQARAYCAFIGGRLPTEAEWEFAARGTDGRKYPWGNEEPTGERAQMSGTAGTAVVGTHPRGASPFGVLDMAGNVREWVADAYAPYPGGSVRDPRQETGESRVLRGGDWEFKLDVSVRSAERTDWGADTAFDTFGIRCAR